MQLVDTVVLTGREILNAEQQSKNEFESNAFLNIVDDVVNTGRMVLNS